jgi:uncharacterized protein (DUF983 family)
MTSRYRELHNPHPLPTFLVPSFPLSVLPPVSPRKNVLVAARRGLSIRAMDLTLQRVAALVWRAVRRHCPNCGGGGLWQDWFHMRRNCPTCGLRLERGEQGYIVGAQMFNIVAAELLFAAIFVGVLLATLPDVPWPWLQYGGPALMILFPVFFYPFSKTLFLAFDLTFRPPTAEDFTERSPS